MQEIEKPGYYSILPATVRYDEKLTSLEKLLYGEITALCDKTGSCWAGNDYFANLFNKHPSTISRNIKKLEKKGHIEIFYKKRGSEITDRVISILKFTQKEEFTSDKNVNGTNDKNINGTNDKNVKYNNTSINNKKNIIKRKFGSLNNVQLTEEEYQKLQNKFEDIDSKIEDLSLYIDSTGKKYASHYSTLLAWYRREQRNKKGIKDNYERL